VSVPGSSRRDRILDALCDLAAWCWIAAWCGLLYLASSPWSDLGGLVGERLRWLERFVLCAAAILGFAGAKIRREASRDAGPPACARGLRWLLYPAGIAAACGMLGLSVAGRDDPAGVVLTGWIAYCTGVWVGYREAARVLLRGGLPD
jgi:hypothetical protein